MLGTLLCPGLKGFAVGIEVQLLVCKTRLMRDGLNWTERTLVKISPLLLSIRLFGYKIVKVLF